MLAASFLLLVVGVQSVLDVRFCVHLNYIRVYFPSYFSDLTMKMEFMGERIKWQERLIKDLEEERTFLREQLAGECVCHEENKGPF